MRIEFKPHNLFKENVKLYLKSDPQLGNIRDIKYVFHSHLEKDIPLDIPGIYILTGGRQVGKSTLIKLIIKKLLLKKGISPGQIFYISCETIQRYQELVSIMQEIFEELDREKSFYLFLDEITYVKEWDRAVKYFADLGYFTKGSLLITGSDSVILKESMKKFPGRRGKSEFTDFHYWPLSFSEYTALVSPGLKNELFKIKNFSGFLENHNDKNFVLFEKAVGINEIKIISKYFQKYLLTGGFLPAINNYEEKKRIGRFVYQTYQQWVVGDFLKRNKKEHFLKDIITVLSERMAKQVSLHNIASKTEIQHHATVQEYLKILEDMDIIFVQQALREDKLTPAPKKAKKIHFTDPFIAQAIICWARDLSVPWEFAGKNIIAESQIKEDITEGCIVSLFKRKYKTYYIKSEGEVDVAIVFGKRFIPLEIKWTETLKRNELKQILKYKTGIIGYKGLRFGKYEHLYVMPIPVLALII